MLCSCNFAHSWSALHSSVTVPACDMQEALKLQIRTTAQAVLAAHVPPGCRRTVYVCDDGKDPVKRVCALPGSLPCATLLRGSA
jgi:hypothetical protein